MSLLFKTGDLVILKRPRRLYSRPLTKYGFYPVDPAKHHLYRDQIFEVVNLLSTIGEPRYQLRSDHFRDDEFLAQQSCLTPVFTL